MSSHHASVRIDYADERKDPLTVSLETYLRGLEDCEDHAFADRVLALRAGETLSLSDRATLTLLASPTAEPSGASAPPALLPAPEGSARPAKCRSCSGYGRAEHGGYCWKCASNRHRGWRR